MPPLEVELRGSVEWLRWVLEYVRILRFTGLLYI